MPRLPARAGPVLATAVLAAAVLVTALAAPGAEGGGARAQGAPATLAVLPLTQGAGSDEYRGLGQALAGMLVSDLSGVAALQLVERDRLDALLDELALGESGFVDEATAQRLGRGLGARWVLTGSYSVVGETFVLDGRVIHVESGAIGKAASATGSPGDFVAVEKELVETLLDGIEVALTAAERRALYVSAPTEKFDAFAAYGEGLAAQDDGDAAAAAAAFERAVTLDPRFAEARAALDGVRSLVDTARDERQASHESAASAAHASILAAYPSDLDRPPRFEYDVETLAGFALRLMVLQNERRHCERYEEMGHYLDRVGWQVELPPGRASDGGVLSFVADQMAKEHGFSKLDSDVEAPEAAYHYPGGRTELFRSTQRFVLDESHSRQRGEDSGWLAAAAGCFEPPALLDVIDGMIAAAREHGVADLTEMPNQGSFSVEQALQLTWCEVRAEHLGADAELERRTAALLQASEVNEHLHSNMIREIDEIVKLADRWEESSLRRLGLSDDELVQYMADVGDRNPERLVTGDVICDYYLSTYSLRAQDWGIRYAEAVAQQTSYIDDMLDSAGAEYAAVRDLGCLVGTEPRVANIDELVAFVQGVPARLRPEMADDAGCVRGIGQMELFLNDHAIQMAKDYPVQAPPLYSAVWTTYWSVVVFNRCVDEQW